MTSVVCQQPSTLEACDIEQDSTEMERIKNDSSTTEQPVPSKDNFPKGLRGGGACFDCLACLCFCCALEEIACLECCLDC